MVYRSLAMIIFGSLVYSKCVCDEGDVSGNTLSGFNANDFVCIDDTKFKHFVDSENFFVKSCSSPGLCFTRVPPNKNPCIGEQRAREIDNNFN
jgi:hypothetical protein